MIETMHRDSNANLYPIHTFFADAPSKSGNLPIPNAAAPGEQLGFGALLKGTSAVVLRVERAL